MQVVGQRVTRSYSIALPASGAPYSSYQAIGYPYTGILLPGVVSSFLTSGGAVLKMGVCIAVSWEEGTGATVKDK